jgi:hypothetical protein
VARARTTKRTVSDSHKKALAMGRDESMLVRRYLEAIEAPRRRGRQRTAEGIRKRLEVIDRQLEGASAIKRLQLIQEQTDLHSELDEKTNRPVDLNALRRDFIKVARTYGERKGISYTTWRAVGVDAGTLKAAGITR